MGLVFKDGFPGNVAAADLARAGEDGTPLARGRPLQAWEELNRQSRSGTARIGFSGMVCLFLREDGIMNHKFLRRYILDAVLSLVGGGVLLFWPAGRIDWWPGWGVLAVNAFMMAAMGFVIFRKYPELAAERLSPPKGAKPWDVAINSGVRLSQAARYVVAGLDFRYGWTGGFPLGIQITGLIASFLGYAIVPWAVANNKFFSQIVRIQSDRGHAVAAGGPDRFVRHPSYLGMIAFELAVPVMLASWGAILISIGTVFLIILRTALEDRTLQNELPGYAEYAQRVRYRLIPGIW
jgi:protein-S-isoprenylcysteine O-methyltransferase Ste14